jgi:geranylgeranyl diphosphate synthase type I
MFDQDYLKRRIDEEVLNSLKGEPEVIYQASSHLLRGGGKRLRPLILLAFSSLLGGNIEWSLPLAAGIELFHNFTLIHDDIMDEDEYRRGLKTVHVIWGIPLAILAGDLLFSKAFEKFSKANIDSGLLVKALKVFVDASIMVSEGQALDIIYSSKPLGELREKDYLNVIIKKTAYLFSASSKIGAIIATGNEEEISRAELYGLNLGIAFQIRDDIIGLTESSEITGKPQYSDLREGKRTILIIKAMEFGNEEERKEIERVLGNKLCSISDFERVVKIIERTGSLDYAINMSKRYANTALDHLEGITPKDEEAMQYLKKLVKSVVERRY